MGLLFDRVAKLSEGNVRDEVGNCVFSHKEAFRTLRDLISKVDDKDFPDFFANNVFDMPLVRDALVVAAKTRGFDELADPWINRLGRNNLPFGKEFVE